MSAPPDPDVGRVESELVVPFRHSLSHPIARFLTGLRDRQLFGLQCTVCGGVHCPPAEVCAPCFARTSLWVELPPRGWVKAFSVVRITFPGQPVPPPFVYAEIVIEGAANVLVHRVGGTDTDLPDAGVRVGQQVEAVWADEPAGSLLDIDHFRPIP